MKEQILNSIDKTLAEAQLVTQRSGYSSGATRILIALHRSAPMRVTELAAAVGVTQQATGKMLRELQAKGFCIINVYSSDGRARLIDLTAGGNKAIAKIEKVWR